MDPLRVGRTEVYRPKEIPRVLRVCKKNTKTTRAAIYVFPMILIRPFVGSPEEIFKSFLFKRRAEGAQLMRSLFFYNE